MQRNRKQPKRAAAPPKVQPQPTDRVGDGEDADAALFEAELDAVMKNSNVPENIKQEIVAFQKALEDVLQCKTFAAAEKLLQGLDSTDAQRQHLLAALGRSKEMGVQCAEDLPAAIALYERAAEAGSTFAATNLATMLEQGRGCAKDNERAEELARTAAEAGNPVAMTLLAYLLLEKPGYREQAREWAERAARCGIATAAFMVGSMCEQKGDADAALRFYEQAAAGGDSHAMIRAGLLQLEQGNRPAARAHWDKAAQLKHPDAPELLRQLDQPPPDSPPPEAAGASSSQKRPEGKARKDDADAKRAGQQLVWGVLAVVWLLDAAMLIAFLRT